MQDKISTIWDDTICSSMAQAADQQQQIRNEIERKKHYRIKKSIEQAEAYNRMLTFLKNRRVEYHGDAEGAICPKVQV